MKTFWISITCICLAVGLILDPVSAAPPDPKTPDRSNPEVPSAPSNWGNGKVLFFSCQNPDEVYFYYDAGEYQVETPQLVEGNWPGWPKHWGYDLDAAVDMGAGQAWFFRDHDYLVYDIPSDTVISGPTSIYTISGFPAAWSSVYSAVNWGNGKIMMFFNKEYLIFDIASQSVEPGYPKEIQGNWPGWPADWAFPDAIANWGNGKIYFFRGGEYLSFDRVTDKVDPGYPQSIQGNWPGWPDDWSEERGGLPMGDGTIVFFEGTSNSEDAEFIRYDLSTGQLSQGPEPVEGNWAASTWPSSWDCVDATLNYGSGKVYFFSRQEYLSYDVAAGQVDPGYPKLIRDGWPGWPSSWDGIDAAVYWGGSQAYFFYGSQYLLFDLNQNRVNPAYPKQIADGWPNWPYYWTGTNAAANWGIGKAYFFNGTQWLRYDLRMSAVEVGFPTTIKGRWPNWPLDNHGNIMLPRGGATWGTTGFPRYQVYLPVMGR